MPVVLLSGLKAQTLASLPLPWAIAALLLALGAVVYFRPKFSIVALAAFFVLGWFQFSTLEEVNARGSARPVWEQMKSRPSFMQCYEPYGSRSVMYGLNYYAGRNLPACPDAEKPKP